MGTWNPALYFTFLFFAQQNNWVLEVNLKQTWALFHTLRTKLVTSWGWLKEKCREAQQEPIRKISYQILVGRHRGRHRTHMETKTLYFGAVKWKQQNHKIFSPLFFVYFSMFLHFYYYFYTSKGWSLCCCCFFSFVCYFASFVFSTSWPIFIFRHWARAMSLSSLVFPSLTPRRMTVDAGIV